MYAIIRDGKGGNYTSTVFGYYCPVLPSRSSRRRLFARIHNQFFVVLSEDKKRLVRKAVFPQKRRFDPLVLIVDPDCEDWIMDQEGYGCVGFLAGIDFAANGVEAVTPALLERCIRMDSAYVYHAYRDVRTEADLQGLFCASGGFHDARIKKCRQDDGRIYVLFDGTWGCKIELWFEGEAACSEGVRDPRKQDPWYAFTLVKEDGFYYLVDDDPVDVKHLDGRCCWFRARNLRFHVIPDP